MTILPQGEPKPPARPLRKRPVAVSVLMAAGAALGSLIDAGILRGDLILAAHALLETLFG